MLDERDGERIVDEELEDLLRDEVVEVVEVEVEGVEVEVVVWRRWRWRQNGGSMEAGGAPGRPPSR